MAETEQGLGTLVVQGLPHCLGLGRQPAFSKEPIQSPEIGHGPPQNWEPGYTSQYLFSLTWQYQQASFVHWEDASAKTSTLRSLHGNRGHVRRPVPLPSLLTPAGGTSQHRCRSPEPDWLTPSLQYHLSLLLSDDEPPILGLWFPPHNPQPHWRGWRTPGPHFYNIP